MQITLRLSPLALTLVLFVFVSAVFGQNEIGLNRPSLRWSQLNTPAGRVIFPRGLDTLAFFTASRMNFQREHDHTIAGDRITKRVPVIIQNQSTLPAGFSTPAP